MQVTPIHKKGCKQDFKNYHPVSVVGLLAKLYAYCLNLRLKQEATVANWRTPTQKDFHKQQQLEDLLLLVNYIISRSEIYKMLLII